MYTQMNEDVAWQRVVDLQREMENSRIWADGSRSLLGWAGRMLRRAWILAGIAMQRLPLRRPAPLELDGSDRSESRPHAA